MHCPMRRYDFYNNLREHQCAQRKFHTHNRSKFADEGISWIILVCIPGNSDRKQLNSSEAMPAYKAEGTVIRDQWRVHRCRQNEIILLYWDYDAPLTGIFLWLHPQTQHGSTKKRPVLLPVSAATAIVLIRSAARKSSRAIQWFRDGSK